MTTRLPIPKERLEQILAHCKRETPENMAPISAGSAVEIIGALLAAHEQEPVAAAYRLFDKSNEVAHPWKFAKCVLPESEGDIFRVEVMPLYAHPAPVPAVYLSSDTEYMAEDAECLTMNLDKHNVPKEKDGQELSLWGRVVELCSQQAPAPAVPEDYFASLVIAARLRAEKAMRKFPQPNYVLNKVAEESGEVIKAVIHYTEGREEWANVEGEIIDNLAMLIRLVTEGDQVIGFTPPESCRAAMLNGGKS